MARSLTTIAVAAVLLLALVKLTGCSALLAASAAESADVALKAYQCVADNWDNNDPKQSNAFGDAATASIRATDIADFGRTMEADTDGGKYTDAQWADMQGEADAELARATASLASTPMYGGMSANEYRKKTGSYVPDMQYLIADDRKNKAAKRVALIKELKGQDLKGMVAEVDKATDQAVQAAAKVPKCRDVAQKSRPNAFANRDLFGSQGGAVKGGGGRGPGAAPGSAAGPAS